MLEQVFIIPRDSPHWFGLMFVVWQQGTKQSGGSLICMACERMRLERGGRRMQVLLLNLIHLSSSEVRHTNEDLSNVATLNPDLSNSGPQRPAGFTRGCYLL